MLGIFLLVVCLEVESRQYNTQYFSELVSQSNEQGLCDISDGMVIAYCEALSGALLCIIPEPTSKIAAGILFGDEVTRTAAYLEQRSMKNQAKQLERESNLGREERTEPNYDRDTWDKEY